MGIPELATVAGPVVFSNNGEVSVRWRDRSDSMVFIDDYVVGNLPAVCVFTGEPADRTMRYRSQSATNPAWLLLLLLGPIGWIALLAVIVSPGRSPLIGTLPISTVWWTRRQSVKRTGWLLLAAAMVLLLSTVWLGEGSQRYVLLIPALGCLMGAMAIRLWLPFQWPTVELDASGRWVTLGAVHPNFARALASTHDSPSTRGVPLDRQRR